MTVSPSSPQPFTVHEVLLIERLRRRGIPSPKFATREEIEQWLDAHRHLVEKEGES